jgi:hypothetical protein
VSKDEEGTKKDDDAVGDSNGGAPDMVLNANVRTPYVTFDSSSDDGRAPREAVVVDELAPPDGASVGDGGPEGIFDADCAIAADAGAGGSDGARDDWKGDADEIGLGGGGADGDRDVARNDGACSTTW